MHFYNSVYKVFLNIIIFYICLLDIGLFIFYNYYLFYK